MGSCVAQNAGGNRNSLTNSHPNMALVRSSEASNGGNTANKRKNVADINNDLSDKREKCSESEKREETSASSSGTVRQMLVCLYRLDITLSRKMSVCADKNSGFWRTVMVILEISGHGVPWIIAALFSILVFTDSRQEFACNLLLALLMDLVIVGGLKIVVRRERPVYNAKDMFATVSVDNYSFPSGHSTRAVMVAGLFAVFLVREVWSIFIGCWAACVSASRVILGRHHLSDVFFGVMIGLLQCWVICAVWIPNPTCEELLKLLPFFGTLRDQIGIYGRGN